MPSRVWGPGRSSRASHFFPAYRTCTFPLDGRGSASPLNCCSLHRVPLHTLPSSPATSMGSAARSRSMLQLKWSKGSHADSPTLRRDSKYTVSRSGLASFASGSMSIMNSKAFTISSTRFWA